MLLQVIAGQATEIFKRHPMPSHARWSFSLLYKEDDEELRTLDLTCKNEQEFTLWYWGIQVCPVTTQASMCLALYSNTVSVIVDNADNDDSVLVCHPRGLHSNGCEAGLSLPSRLVPVCPYLFWAGQEQQQSCATIDEKFRATYDFVYLPIDFMFACVSSGNACVTPE